MLTPHPLGAGSMPDKVTALLHSINMEAGDFTEEYCKAVIALVSDQGTEHLIADCGPISTDTIRQDDADALRCSGNVKLASQPSFEQDDSLQLGDRNSFPAVIDLVQSESDTEQRTTLATKPTDAAFKPSGRACSSTDLQPGDALPEVAVMPESTTIPRMCQPCLLLP